MTITRPVYCTREEVKGAGDIKSTARNDEQVDIALESAADSVEGLLHRVFYPTLDTRYVDWPNFQNTYPWKIYLDAAELADITSIVPVVTSGGNVIPAGDIFWGSPRYVPPYTYFELNRATSATFGQGNTPQRDVAITGLFGAWAKTTPAGALAAAVSDTTATTVTVTNGAALGVGDNFLVDSERMLVVERANVTTGQTQQGSGCSTASAADVALAVTDGTKFYLNEVLQLDSERMKVVDVTGNTVTVKRAWDGTVLAAHSGATIYASRQLTVLRAVLGTTAAAHSIAATVNRATYPGIVKALSLAEAVVEARQKVGAYTDVQGADGSKQTNIGKGLPDLRARAVQAFGRTGRSRAV